jgi:hypothetical protein
MHIHRVYPFARKLLITRTIVLALALGTLRLHAADTTPPTISGVPSAATVECSSIPPAATPTATDDTDPNPSIVLNESSTQTPTGCSHSSYTLTRTWIATDSSGNSSSASQQLTVQDTTPPVINYIPANTTVECSAIPAPPIAVTNCAGITTPAQLRISDGTPGGTIVITDQGPGDSSATPGQITFSGPVGTGWSINVTTGLTTPVPGFGSSVQPTMNLSTGNVGAGQLTIEFSANGFCATGVMQSQVGGVTSGSIEFKTWIDTGNTNFGKQTLVHNFGPIPAGAFSSNAVATVNPSLPYSITLQSVITHTTTAASSFSSQVGVFLPTATDNCDPSLNFTFNETSTQTTNGPGQGNYVVTRTWTATDACGNSSTAQQIITVHDTTPPVITGYPADATLDCMCNLPPANDALITATDNCSDVTISHGGDVPTNIVDALHFDIQRTYTATDTSGNQSSYTQTFHMSLYPPPTITITGAPNIQTTVQNYVAHGTANGTYPIASVYYSFNNAPFQLASGTTAWSANLHLTAGTNTLAAYAIDIHGVVSTTAVATVFYSVKSKLIVQIRDWPEPNQIDPNAGTITPNLNGQLLEIGRAYTMTAAALGSHRFLGWAYTTNIHVPPFDTNNTLTFVMTANLKLIARFETPFYHLAGTWSGLFGEPTPDFRSSGFIAFNLPYTNNVANNGYYAGRILLDGTHYDFHYPSGFFDTSGHSHLVVPRPGKDPLVIDMDMDVVTYSSTLTGTMTTPDWTANLLMHRGWTNVGNAEFRRYTMAFPPETGPTPSPTGWGVAATTNGPYGIVHFLGYAADGAKINTPVTSVSENLQYPMYGQLYGTASTGYKGSMWGWLTFSKNQPGVTGTLYWWRPAGVTDAGYTAGFSNVFQVIGSPYTNYPTGTPEFNWTGPAIATFNDGFTIALTSTATVDNNDKVTFTPPNANRVALIVSRLNGLFNGTFLQPFVRKIDPPFRGVILQNIHSNLGNFWTKTNAGAITFEPN